jgi:hypothetical protein
MFELQGLMREAAARMGIGVDELTMAPDGLPALAASLLDSAVPPLGDAERAKVREVLDAMQADWAAYAKTHASLTKLEKDRELSRMWDRLNDGVLGALPEDQGDAWADMTGFCGNSSCCARTKRSAGCSPRPSRRCGRS